MDEPSSGAIERWSRIFTNYVAPTSLLISLFYYFGYIRSAALYSYFGLDLRALDLSTEDYLLRGVDALFVPVGCLMLLAMIGLWARWYSQILVANHIHLRPLVWGAYVTFVIGVALFMLGAIGVVVPQAVWWAYYAPLLIGSGLLLVAFAGTLDPIQRRLARAGFQYRASMVLLLGLLILSVFWTANLYAQAYGVGRAETLRTELRQRPRVILDTKERLFADAPGVSETALLEGGEYRFRYRGYRLFAQSEDFLFLIPELWTPAAGSILATPDGPANRVQFSAP